MERIIKPLPTVTVKDPGQFAQEQKAQINLFLYFISAFAINRVAMMIEHRVQVPGMLGAGK